MTFFSQLPQKLMTFLLVVVITTPTLLRLLTHCFFSALCKIKPQKFLLSSGCHPPGWCHPAWSPLSSPIVTPLRRWLCCIPGSKS